MFDLVDKAGWREIYSSPPPEPVILLSFNVDVRANMRLRSSL
jgi:hypothetical protein